jgi:hypothetical protein
VDADSSDEVETSDIANAFSLTDEISDQAQTGDEVDWATSGLSAGGVVANDSAATEYEANPAIVDDSQISDFVAGDAPIESLATTAARANDSADGFNWTAWLTANIDRAIARYYCTITGAADLLEDIKIPITSFQAQKRSGYETYISAIISGLAYAEEVSARPNGEMIIDMAYVVDGVESLREEILRADIEQINIYKESQGRSINIIGRQEQTFVAKESRVYNPIYKSRAIDGSYSFRFAAPDLYLSPGDTARVGSDSFTVSSISYLVSGGGGQTMMEVQG